MRLAENFRWPKCVLVLSLASGPMLGLYAGFVASKPLFIKERLDFSENVAMCLFHIPEGIRLLSGLVAAVLADSYFGKFTPMALSYFTMWIFTWPVYLLSSYPLFDLITRRIFYSIAIVFDITNSYGSTLYMPFISEQFKMPEQELALQRYYVYDYTYLNICSIIFTSVLFELINRYHCFGSKCTMMIIGLCLITNLIYSIIFVSMKRLYIIKIPDKNPITESLFCFCYAVRKRFSSNGKRDHFLDYADDKYSEKTISDVKIVLRVMVVIGIYFAYSVLHLQLSSKWIYQADLLDRNFGSWTLKTEQVEVVNPLVVIAFAPILEHKIFPAASNYGVLKTSLQKMGLSYFLASLTFFMAGLLQYFIERNVSYWTTDEYGQIRLINLFVKSFSVEVMNKIFLLKPLEMRVFTEIERSSFLLRASSVDNVRETWYAEVQVMQQRSITYLLLNETLVKVDPEIEITKNETRNPLAIIICISCNSTVEIEQGERNWTFLPPENGRSIFLDLNDEYFEISYQNNILGLKIDQGSIYAFIIHKWKGKFEITKFKYYDPEKIHVVWIMPQFFVLSIAEVIQYVGTSMFIYTQSPATMRSVVRALYISANSLAHFSIGLLSLFEIPSSVWYFSLATFLLLATLTHILYARRYQYQTPID